MAHICTTKTISISNNDILFELIIIGGSLSPQICAFLMVLDVASLNLICMFTDRKPRELLKQYSRISIVDGTSFQANLNRQQSVKNFNNTGLSLQRGLSKKELINALNRENTEENQGKDVGFIMMRDVQRNSHNSISFNTYLLI